MMKRKKLLVLALILIGVGVTNAQQDPLYTQYMYNTQVVNPGYSASRDVLSVGLLGRTQWVGFEGSPQTGTFSISGPVGPTGRNGLGLTVLYDEIGPSVESSINVDYAYRIEFRNLGKLSLGLKGGLNILDVNFNKLNAANSGDIFDVNNIDNKIQPQIGAGVYYYTDKFYAGVSIPNFLKNEHFDSSTINDIYGGNYTDTTAEERMHFYFITGYVFDLNPNLKFKPAALFKAVNGSPMQGDFSANFLIREKLMLGAAYRTDAALSALAGFQISNSIFAGLAYDYQTNEIQAYNDGSYEFFIRFDIFNKGERILTPRFF